MENDNDDPEGDIERNSSFNNSSYLNQSSAHLFNQSMGLGNSARNINETQAAADTLRMRSDRHLAMSDRLENGLATSQSQLSRHSTKSSSSKDDSTEGGEGKKKGGLMANLWKKVDKLKSVVSKVATLTGRTEGTVETQHGRDGRVKVSDDSRFHDQSVREEDDEDDGDVESKSPQRISAENMRGVSNRQRIAKQVAQARQAKL